MYDEKYEWVYVARYFGMQESGLAYLGKHIPFMWRVNSLRPGTLECTMKARWAWITEKNVGTVIIR